MINLIWAMDENWLIGKDNKIPWHIKEDLLYFKSKTNDKEVLMGYNTYISLKGYYKNRPLPYKKIYLVTRKKMIFEDALVIPSSLDEFMSNFSGELFVIGGSSIYSQTLKYANRLYISFIKGSYTGDSYFSKFDLNMYDLISKEETDKVIYTVYEKKVL